MRDCQAQKLPGPTAHHPLLHLAALLTVCRPATSLSAPGYVLKCQTGPSLEAQPCPGSRSPLRWQLVLTPPWSPHLQLYILVWLGSFREALLAVPKGGIFLRVGPRFPLPLLRWGLLDDKAQTSP